MSQGTQVLRGRCFSGPEEDECFLLAGPLQILFCFETLFGEDSRHLPRTSRAWSMSFQVGRGTMLRPLSCCICELCIVELVVVRCCVRCVLRGSETVFVARGGSYGQHTQNSANWLDSILGSEEKGCFEGFWLFKKFNFLPLETSLNPFGYEGSICQCRMQRG